MDEPSPRVVVKFLDDADVDERLPEDGGQIKGLLARLEDADQEGAVAILDRLRDLMPIEFDFAGKIVERVLTGFDQDAVRGLIGQAGASHYGPRHLLRYFTIRSADGYTPSQALDVAEFLRTWRIVETAYVGARPGEPPAVNTSIRVLSPVATEQRYLRDLGIRSCWALPGGQGDGVRLVDIEAGWNVDPCHACLPQRRIILHPGHTPNHRDRYLRHGNAVLGTVLAQHARRGGKGIAPNAGAYLVCTDAPEPDGTGFSRDHASAMITALLHRQPCDVFLLEAQSKWRRRSPNGETSLVTGLPVEVESHVLELIRLATALGVVVVEPAGNGSDNLDRIAAEIKTREDRDVLANRDSGAILVGALRGGGTTHDPFERLPSSNFGCRIDCYAPGEWILAPWTVRGGEDHDDYTDTDFGETSAAGAIIAGAVVVLQAIAKQRQTPLDPLAIRTALSRSDINTPLAIATCDSPDRAPVMPNLRRIVNEFGWDA